MKWLGPFLSYLAVAIGLFRFQSAWAALVGFHLAILLSLWIAGPDLPVRILFKSTDPRWILYSLLLSVGSGVVLFALWDHFRFTGNLAAQVEALGLRASIWPPFIAYFVLANPLVEEYFWRGYLGSGSTGVTVSDILYSGFHGLILVNKLQPGMILFCLAVLVLAGWFWRQIRREDGGLLAPVLGHMAADLSILLAVYWKVTA